jgi:hypothetical protein
MHQRCYQWTNVRDIWYWDFTEIFQETQDFLKIEKKKISATFQEDKNVCPVDSCHVGSATERRMHFCATVGMITAFIALLTATCVRKEYKVNALWRSHDNSG